MDSSLHIIPGGHLTTPLGFQAGAVCAGMYAGGPKAGALDLALLVSERECSAAAVFTQNAVKGHPVIVSRERVDGGQVRAVIANSGCSNSLNGPDGYDDAIEMTLLAAKLANLTPDAVTVASTGVTGVRMPMEKLRAGVPRIVLTPVGGPDFARAIMTTDLRPKEVAVRVQDGPGSYMVAGCAKGSGMIHPNMATMLCYLTTDASMNPELADATLRRVVDDTLNMISIDGDTSCSDTTLLLANGAARGAPIEGDTERARVFEAALRVVATHLARELARDGEGATRLIEVAVTGAVSQDEARCLARTITTSPLVKTAVAGCDPNWGRILVAAGRAGVAFEEPKTSLRLQGETLFGQGRALPFDEAALSALMDVEEVRIEVDLGLGDGSATAWGCDLTTDYVHINADYRT